MLVSERFESHGIHTRLHYIVKRVGGLDKEARRNYLKNKYGFDEETLDIVLMYNVEKFLKDKTLEEIKELIKITEHNKEVEQRIARRKLNNMLTSICCATDMLHFGRYW